MVCVFVLYVVCVFVWFCGTVMFCGICVLCICIRMVCVGVVCVFGMYVVCVCGCVCVTDILFRAKHTIHIYFLHFGQCFCVNHCPRHKETSLLRSV